MANFSHHLIFAGLLLSSVSRPGAGLLFSLVDYSDRLVARLMSLSLRSSRIVPHHGAIYSQAHYGFDCSLDCMSRLHKSLRLHASAASQRIRASLTNPIKPIGKKIQKI